MKVIELSLRLIWKRKFTYLILIFQTIVSIIIFISLVGKVQNISHSKATANIFNGKNAFYFTPYTYYDTNTFDLEKILPDAAAYELGKVSEVELITDSGKHVLAYGYNDTIIKYTKVTLNGGKWFDKNNKYDYIPIISIGSKYSIDDIVSLRGGEQKSEILCRVIGTIKENEYITAFMSGSSKNDATLENIISTANADFILPFECRDILSIKEKDIDIYNYNYNYGTIIIMKNSAHNEIYELLDQYGEVSDINSMITNFSNEMRDYFLSNGIVLLVFTLLGLSGIGGINSMLNISNKRRYIIYYMCGMTQKMCAAAEAVRSSVVIIAGFVISYFLINFTSLGNLFPPDAYTINFMTYVYVLFYLIGIYLLTSLYFVIDLKKQNLIEMYKQKA